MKTIDQRETKTEQVRKREELRLIKIANKTGLFTKRISTAQLESLFRDGIEVLGHLKESQLLRLEIEMAKAKKGQSEEARREDTRRKILLGSFLIAQMEHKPVLRADMVAELDQFLELHKDPKAVERNKELLKEWLVPVSPEQTPNAPEVTP